MPIDYSHIHTTRQVMDTDDPKTPISPTGSDEAALAAHISDMLGAHAANTVSFAAGETGLDATNVQEAVVEVLGLSGRWTLVKGANGVADITEVILSDEFKLNTDDPGIALLGLNVPTSDPGVAGRVWSDAGVLKVSAG